MSLGVVRMKRKAFEEPLEALVIALKKSKLVDEQCEIHLKFAATIPKQEDFECGKIQAVMKQDKLQREHWRQSPKQIPLSSSGKRVQYYKAERKLKREQVVAGRRLVLTQLQVNEKSNDKENGHQETDGSHGFVLYDIIEENEDLRAENKNEISDSDSNITCNGAVLQKVSPNTSMSREYVYDLYYVMKGSLNDDFDQGPFNIEPCEPHEELVQQFNEEEEPDEYYDDEDDSNDEDNWRNDYPDEDTNFDRDYFGDYEDEVEDVDLEYTVIERFKQFHIDDEKECPAYSVYKAKVLNEFDGDENDGGY